MFEYILVAVFVMFVILVTTAFLNEEFKYVSFDDMLNLILVSGVAAAFWPITVAVAIFAGLSYLMVLAAAYVAKFIKGQLNKG